LFSDNNNVAPVAKFQLSKIERRHNMSFGKNTLAAVAALALVAIPVTAQAADSMAKPVASKAKRVGTASNKESKLGGGTALYAAIAIIIGIVGIVVVSDDDSPTSP
jgi:hypothetical protein